MIIEDDKDSEDKPQIINTNYLLSVFAAYKLPLILGGVGVILLAVALGLLIKTQYSSQDIVFKTSTASASFKIRVDIQGSVMSPGVYEMQEGSRVGDALTISGGLAAGADRDWVAKNLNRAAKIIDGGKIYIPSAVETASGQTSSSAKASADKQNSTDVSSISTISNSGNLLGVTTKTININSATLPELDTLPGVGTVTANRIISGRPYQSVEELKSRKIIGQSLYNKIKDSLVIY